MTRKILGPPKGSPSAVGRCSRCGGSHKLIFGRSGNIVRGQSCKSPRPETDKAPNQRRRLVSTGGPQGARLPQWLISPQDATWAHLFPPLKSNHPGALSVTSLCGKRFDDRRKIKPEWEWTPCPECEQINQGAQ